MNEARALVSISAASSNLALATAAQALLVKQGVNVVLDVPSTERYASNWGEDETEVIDRAFGDSALYCILLLDRAWDPLESTCRHASLSIL